MSALDVRERPGGVRLTVRVQPRAVRIVSGDAARTKVVDVDGVEPARVRRLVPSRG